MHDSVDRAETADRRAEADFESADRLPEPDDGAIALRLLARLSVPLLADWCAIHVPDGDGRLQPTEILHHDAARLELARRLHREHPPDPDAEIGAYAVLHSGEPQLIAEVTDEILAAGDGDAGDFKLMRKLGVRSAMIVPLRNHQRTVGVMTLATAESGRRFAESDVGRALDLAAQAATALENARLYALALEAQRTEAIRAHAVAESARAEAERASRAKTEFLAVMSHELRTPLNAIMGYVDLLEGAVAGPLTETQARHLVRIRSSATHLLSMINQILSLSRMEAGKEELSVESVDLIELARDVASTVEPAAAAKGLALQLHLPDASRPVHTDGGKLRQILLNLMSNAIKFTDRGVVELMVQLDGDALACTVRDSGIGIAAADLDRIFEPFVQVDSSSTRQRGGTGLGLPVSRRFAHMLGGEIAVNSEPGTGTTFSLVLPLREEPTAPTTTAT